MWKYCIPRDNTSPLYEEKVIVSWLLLISSALLSMCYLCSLFFLNSSCLPGQMHRILYFFYIPAPYSNVTDFTCASNTEFTVMKSWYNIGPEMQVVILSFHSKIYTSLEKISFSLSLGGCVFESTLCCDNSLKLYFFILAPPDNILLWVKHHHLPVAYIQTSPCSTIQKHIFCLHLSLPALILLPRALLPML